MPGYHSGINILGAGVEVTKVTLCASFCGKSLSRPSLCNLDSTPPQVINAATNDGEPCSGGQSPTSQDFAPIHPAKAKPLNGAAQWKLKLHPPWSLMEAQTSSSGLWSDSQDPQRSHRLHRKSKTFHVPGRPAEILTSG